MNLSRQLIVKWLSQKGVGIASASNKSLLRYSTNSKPFLTKNYVKKVEPFGKIFVDIPGDVEIKTTDPHKYSGENTLIVNVYSKNKETPDDIIKVNMSSDTCEIKSVQSDNILQGIKCSIQAPPRYDVEVKTTGEGNVDVTGMVSDIINVQTEFGNIYGSKLQGQTISLSSSEGGSVTLKNNIQGDIEINTAKNGTIDAEKCMGTKLDISTESGNVTIGSNYCEAATFTTADGKLNLNNLHMDSTVDISGTGTLNISCLDGSLRANIGEGDAVIQVARITGNSSVTSNGNILLKIPEDSENSISLQADNLNIDKTIDGQYSDDKKIFTIEKNDCKFDVKTEKNIQLTRASWMDGLNLQKRSG
ncbi:hypothetical protein HCN44_003202 [Aphidius gifuensis]|uniref:DUF4097 domain-containing protein n=1 Tax=Aphidius gifuensis TaxID=684658 RepID=A0A835CNU6_APHGI|nr:uncharacterized protein LOC122859125 [Aphidius gifuensis]KAF7987440.1 hypothetical protein HCN44_003202 [Aphidius gifuensis]